MRIGADYQPLFWCLRRSPELLRESYANIVPSKRLHQVGKDTGETAHIERFNNTLRQRCVNLVRKTLSFSKDEILHQVRIRLFIDQYNLTCTSQA